jgi:hypothetical protein
MKQFTPLILLAALAAPAADLRDPKAVEIANKMVDAMGGQEAWAKARYVRFDFRFMDNGAAKMERSHLWDKSTGRYRLDSKTKDGKSSVVLMNLADRKGSVFVDGKKLEGEPAAKGLKDAYGSYINDFYWLAMPWKWTDQGVNLKYLGQKPCKSGSCEVVELTFGKVGLTPGDRYRAFVNPKTNLMEHWEYTLQSGNEGSWDWEYVKTGGVMLASNHSDGKGKALNMGGVKILDRVDGAVFEDPKAPF